MYKYCTTIESNVSYDLPEIMDFMEIGPKEMREQIQIYSQNFLKSHNHDTLISLHDALNEIGCVRNDGKGHGLVYVAKAILAI